MSDFNAVCHGCHGDSITRKRIRSGKPGCQNELIKCQQELSESKADNVRLSNVICGLKAQIVDLERHIDHLDEIDDDNMSSVLEIDKCKAKAMELAAENSFLDAELTEMKEVQGTRARREYVAKKQVLKAFQWKEEETDPQLLQAVTAFWEAFSERKIGTSEWRQLSRKSKQDRMIAWKYVTEYGWDGDMLHELEAGFVEKRKFSAIEITRSSDLDSNFNLKVVSDLNKCDPKHEKYSRSILPSDRTCRRIQERVHRAAVRHGLSSFPAKKNGNVWCWGDEDGRFTKGVNRYVYETYFKSNNDFVTKEKPWIVPVTGDLARVSFRGKGITMCGPKEADPRLPSQHGGYTRRGNGTRESRIGDPTKTMNQSRKLYTPAVAGYTNEADMMPFFKELVDAFYEIERNGHCEVDGVIYPVFISVKVVADMSFLHKYLGRGGGSATTTCFCFMCSSKCHFRHKGYPGGCWRCRGKKSVYHAITGAQQCLHHDACTPEFLAWEQKRFEYLNTRIGPRVPLSKLPLYESVPQLRVECYRRCDSMEERATVRQKTSEAKLQKWLLGKCRRKCILSQMYCLFHIFTRSLFHICTRRRMYTHGKCQQRCSFL